MKLPKVTLGFISYNRLHYLKATLESARQCIQYPDLEWIVIDNVSSEKGLVSYLQGLDFIDRLVLRKSDHASAMNTLVEMAQGEVLLIWPDDMQFVVEGNWMADCVEVLVANPWVGSLGLNCLRKSTVRNLWMFRRFRQWKQWIREWMNFGVKFRTIRTVESSNGMQFISYGWTTDGIIGSGIPSLTRTEVWKQLGFWKTQDKNDKNLVDSSGGAETDMLVRWRKTGIPYQRLIPILPTSADIVTDDIGCKAKVRGDKRYGVYCPPSENGFYYTIKKQTDFDLSQRQVPISFEEQIIPIGFQLPFDNHGNLLKASINKTIVSDI